MILIMVLLASAALGIFASYVNYIGVVKQNADTAAAAAAENVVLSVQGGTLYAANVGGREVQVQDLLIANSVTGSIAEQPYTGTLMPGSQTVITSSALNGVLTPSFLSNGAVGILTTFGNTFWFGNVPPVAGAGGTPNTTTQCPISTVSVISSGAGTISWVGAGASGSTNSFENITPTNGSCPTVTMTETPQPGYKFSEWYVNGAPEPSSSISVDLSTSNSVVAIFSSSSTTQATGVLTVLFSDVSGSPLQGLTTPLSVGLTSAGNSTTAQVLPNSWISGYSFAQFTGLSPGTYTVILPAGFPYNTNFQAVDLSNSGYIQVSVPEISNLAGTQGTSIQVSVTGDTTVMVDYQTQVVSMNAYLNFGSNADPLLFNYGSPGTAVVTAAFSDNQYTNSQYAGYSVKGLFDMVNQPVVAPGQGTQNINYTMGAYKLPPAAASSDISCGSCQGTKVSSGSWNGQFSSIFIQGLGSDLVGGTTMIDCSYVNNNFSCAPYLPVSSINEYIVAPASSVNQTIRSDCSGSRGSCPYEYGVSTFTVVGQMFDPSGNPVAGVPVTLTYSSSGSTAQTATTTTNANGFYEFTGIQVVGSATVSVSPSGSSISATINWNFNGLSKVNIALSAPSSVSGVSMILAGATVSLTNGQSNYYDMMTSSAPSYIYSYKFPSISVTTSSTSNGGSGSTTQTYCVVGSPGTWTVNPGSVVTESVDYTSC